jgi:hypothetical protein
VLLIECEHIFAGFGNNLRFVGRYLDCLPDRRVDVIGEIQLPTGQHPDMIEIQVQRRFGDVHMPDNVPRRDLSGFAMIHQREETITRCATPKIEYKLSPDPTSGSRAALISCHQRRSPLPKREE